MKLSATQQRLLHAMWLELHARPFVAPDLSREPEWLEHDFAPRIPCEECRTRFLAMLRRTPPPLHSRAAYFKWTVERHNEINLTLGKRCISVGDARRITRAALAAEGLDRLAAAPPEIANAAPLPSAATTSAGREVLLLRCNLCPGDLLMLTAAVRELHKAHGDRYEIHVATHHTSLWDNNPHAASVREHDQPLEGARVIDCCYGRAISRSNTRPHHFIHGYCEDLTEKLGVPVPVTEFRGDIHLGDDERGEDPVAGYDVSRPFWLMAAGGGKHDFTAKWADPRALQAAVDHLTSRGVDVVQVGGAADYRADLTGVVDLVGKTSLRDVIRLTHHAQGVISLVSFAMHLAAAVPKKVGEPGRRPCVVLAGGREPPQWEAYPTHQFLHTVGTMPCCESACWKNKGFVPPNDKDESRCPHTVKVPGRTHMGLPLLVTRCMAAIDGPTVVDAIDRYYRGGALSYPDPARPRKPLGMERVEPDGTAILVDVLRRRPPPVEPFAGGERLYHRPPTLGLVVGTRGAVPYIHLQLEAARRFGVTRVLVQDDNSTPAVRDRLAALCAGYGATFGHSTRQFGHHNGDVVAFFHGLLWARERGVELLVKFSRRFQPTRDWVPGLLALAQDSQAHTLSSYCNSYKFGFRSECVGMHVDTWLGGGALEHLRRVFTGPYCGFVEAMVDDFSKSLPRCGHFARWADARRDRMMHDHANFAKWVELMGEDRHKPLPGALWHNFDPPARYHALAVEWGITAYAPEEFEGLNSHGWI